MIKKGKASLAEIALLQAMGIIVYIGLVALIFWKGNEWFGKVDFYLGPVMMLTLLSVSAMVCALLAFGYPFLVMWSQKKPKRALKIVIYETGWLLAFLLGIMSVIAAHIGR